ncbi:MAG: glycosyltransferase [Alphaproteobacteria bacterium]|nr:glycosyltransferase [Alphaproteobacteria bacterium]
MLHRTASGPSTGRARSPQSGGPSRIAHLYRELAGGAEITLLSLCDDPRRAGEQRPAAGLRELCIAKSAAHLEAAAALDAELGASVGDIATLVHHQRTPAFGEALAREAERTDLVIASHPYLYPAIAAVYDGPLWYEAHNVEYDMKRAVIGSSAAAAPYLAHVREVEAAACARAQRVLVCSQDDVQRLDRLYGGVADKALLAANGVDTRAIAYTGPAERARRKARLGLDGRLVALFIGSWHQPNIEAVAELKRIAADCADVDFLVAGSVCDHAELRSHPSNLHPLGVLADAELGVVAAAADVALNLARSGSGTNLKMLHYAAAGLPILSTGFGLRGLALRPLEHLWQAETHAFPAALRALRETDAAALGAMTERARLLVEQRYDWRVIAAGVCAALEQDAGSGCAWHRSRTPG